MRTIHTLDHADAWAALSIAKHLIETEDKRLVMAVVDSHGDLLSFFRHADAMPSSVTVAINKAYTVARLRRTSSALADKARTEKESFDIAYFGDPRVTGFGGGLPVIHQGEILGAIGVSGLSEAEDITIVESAIAAIKAQWKS